MPVLIAIVVLVALIALAVVALDTVASLIWFALVGLVVGALARLIIPGDQKMGWLSTALCGMIGAFIGGLIGDQVGAGDVVTFLLSLVSAAVLVAIFAGVGNREDRRAIN